YWQARALYFIGYEDVYEGKYVMKLGGCEGILGDQISVKKFGNFVEFSALMYVLQEGVDYTRSNNQELPSMLRVYPLFSMDKEPFPDVSISLLPTSISNHWPHLLDCGGLHKGKAQFNLIEYVN
ncbi:Hypothetical predicted protein, partial [Prunus dulcis]